MRWHRAVVAGAGVAAVIGLLETGTGLTQTVTLPVANLVVYKEVRVSGGNLEGINYTVSGGNVTSISGNLYGTYALKSLAAAFVGGSAGSCSAFGTATGSVLTYFATPFSCTGFSQPAARSAILQLTVT